MKVGKIAIVALLIGSSLQASSWLDKAKGYVQKGQDLLKKGQETYSTYAPKAEEFYKQGKETLTGLHSQAKDLYGKYGSMLPSSMQGTAGKFFSTPTE